MKESLGGYQSKKLKETTKFKFLSPSRNLETAPNKNSLIIV